MRGGYAIVLLILHATQLCKATNPDDAPAYTREPKWAAIMDTKTVTAHGETLAAIVNLEEIQQLVENIRLECVTVVLCPLD